MRHDICRRGGRKFEPAAANMQTCAEERDGYVIVEAAVLLPLASILILLLVYLCSYLYQGCFMVQAAYVSAFRGSRYTMYGEAYVKEQLDEILAGEVLSFEPEEYEIKMGMLSVQVALKKDTPLSRINENIAPLRASWKVAVRDPVAYIRGIRRVKS